jgi:hypothetical protein
MGGGWEGRGSAKLLNGGEVLSGEEYDGGNSDKRSSMMKMLM